MIKAYGGEGFEQGRFEASSAGAFAAAFEARALFAFLTVSIFWVTAIGMVVAAGWGALQTARGEMLHAFGSQDPLFSLLFGIATTTIAGLINLSCMR